MAAREGLSGDGDCADEPISIPPRFFRTRFDTIALYVALDRVRKQRGLEWVAVARELGVSPGVIARLTLGGRTNANLIIAAADWAGVAVEALLLLSR